MIPETCFEAANRGISGRAVTPRSVADDSVPYVAASQRVRTRVPAPQRSILPTVPGVSAGAAVLIAVAFTFLGFLIDLLGDGSELTGSFSTMYVIGCLAAVLAVRLRGLFTTLVLPPLLLFVAVPLAYQQLTGSVSTSIKDILLNLAIPLVHRFPAMMIATVLVLLVGAARIVMHRQEQAAEHSTGARRGTSWGRRQADRPRPGRGKGSRTSGAARRKPKNSELDDHNGVGSDVPSRRNGRRRPAPVADAPPRVAAGSSRAREPRREPRAREPRMRELRTRVDRPAAPFPDEPSRPAANRRRGEPPHPQPIVRYRDREPAERRRPETL